MNNTKHTPGPWRIDGTYPTGFGGGELPYQAIDVGGCIDVHVAGNGKTYSGANARLIASAPELLEACEAISNCAKPGTLSFETARKMARAAIAKAEGTCQRNS